MPLSSATLSSDNLCTTLKLSISPGLLKFALSATTRSTSTSSAIDARASLPAGVSKACRSTCARVTSRCQPWSCGWCAAAIHLKWICPVSAVTNAKGAASEFAENCNHNITTAFADVKFSPQHTRYSTPGGQPKEIHRSPLVFAPALRDRESYHSCNAADRACREIYLRD